MKNRKLIVGFAAAVVAGTAFGDVTWFNYSGGWNSQVLMSGTYSALAVDNVESVYAGKSAGGMERTYLSGGSYAAQQAVGIDTTVWNAMDAYDNNQILMIDGDSVDRVYYGSPTYNAMRSGSYTALSAGTGTWKAYMAKSGSGLERSYYSSGWAGDTMGNVSPNTYLDIATRGDDDVIVVGASGMEQTKYSGSWGNTVISSAYSLTDVTLDVVNVAFATIAGGGVMRAFGATYGTVEQLAGISGEYIDIVANPGLANNFFALSADGDVHQVYYAGGWQTVVIATGDYTALDVGDASNQVFAIGTIPEPAALGLLVVFGGGLMFVRKRFAI